MPEVNDLYQEVILEHSKAPRNYRQPAATNRSAEGYNPLCGDHFTVFLDVEGDAIKDIGFQGAGCAISRASASMMTQLVKGKTRAEAEKLFEQFHNLVTGEAGDGSELGKLAVFSGVCKFPARVKCATLAWHTLQSALDGSQNVVSTEE
jgi:nitrogen fixation protein NifU and related proteins